MSNANDFVIKNGVLEKYNGHDAEVMIPDGVTTIGDEAFYGCSSLTAVTIPASVTEINCGTFKGCENLTAVTIPDSITLIEYETFKGCENLTTVTIPDSVTSIGDWAFERCISLTNIEIPVSVTSIAPFAFFDCKSLTVINIPNGVEAIEAFAFHGCESLTTINIPDSVTAIGEFAFCGCDNLAAINIPDSVTMIGEDAFCACIGLKKLTLGIAAGGFAMKHFRVSDDLRIDIPDISALPAKFRICAALCFAEDGGDSTDPRFESHGKYLKANSGKIVETAIQNLPLLALLCREGWINAKDIEAYTDAVQKTGDTEKIAMILDYQNNKLTKKQKENVAKQLKKQENTVLERAIVRMNQVGFAGLNFVVTGNVKTFENRSELKAFIESQGEKLQSSMSAKTDYLIMNDLDSDTKRKRKRKLWASR